MRSNLRVLTAQKSQRDRRRISLRTIADETGINKSTVYAIANDTIREYPKDTLTALCNYFNCTVGDLLLTEDVPDEVAA